MIKKVRSFLVWLVVPVLMITSLWVCKLSKRPPNWRTGPFR